MKRTILYVLLCIVITGQVVNAQSKVTEQQKSEYAKGNQDPKFLKGYIEALKADGQEDALSEAADRYLQVLPLDKRYDGENLTYFMEYVNKLDAKSFMDIVEHWGDIQLTGEQAGKVVGKINDVCKMTFFQALFKERNEKECPDVDCAGLLAALKGSKIPVPELRCQFIEMWQLWKEKKVDDMIRIFGQIVTQPGQQNGNKGENDFQLDLMMDGTVLGSMLGYVLEECNFEQCTKMLEIMDQGIEKNGREGFWDMIGKVRDNFEGKKMMMEMGEE